jgi:hypothetical protein
MNGPQPFSAEALKAYADMSGITREDDLELYLRIVPKLDDVWMEEWYRRDKARQDAAAKPKSGKRH